MRFMTSERLYSLLQNREVVPVYADFLVPTSYKAAWQRFPSPPYQLLTFRT